MSVKPRNESVEQLIQAYEKQCRLTADQADSQDEEDDDDAGDDPYQIRDALYRRVSDEEYNHAQIEMLDRSISLHFNDFVDVVNRTTEGTTTADKKPTTTQTYEPIVLVKAALMACNLEHMARLTASHVPYSELQTLENYDTTKVLNHMKNNPSAKSKVHGMTSEYILALHIVDYATRKAPEVIEKVL